MSGAGAGGNAAGAVPEADECLANAAAQADPNDGPRPARDSGPSAALLLRVLQLLADLDLRQLVRRGGMHWWSPLLCRRPSCRTGANVGPRAAQSIGRSTPNPGRAYLKIRPSAEC